MTDRKLSVSSSDSNPKRDVELWPNNFVSLYKLAANLPHELNQIVEMAQDERPIQTWCEANPVTLLPFLGGTGQGWVFGRPKLGAEFIPDFMLCFFDSSGFHWHLVELENPRFSAITQEGAQNAKLTHAIQQVLDWRIWLRRNVQYAQSQLGYRGLDAGFEASIVMGRRNEMSQSVKDRYRELSRDGVTVMTYDRFLERVAS